MAGLRRRFAGASSGAGARLKPPDGAGDEAPASGAWNCARREPLAIRRRLRSAPGLSPLRTGLVISNSSDRRRGWPPGEMERRIFLGAGDASPGEKT
jgi:hypothetical protein